jgi:flagella synthesis protein FlgN
LINSIPASQTADFSSRLNEERAALRAFVVLLEKEQQTLLNQSVEQLQALAEAKTLSALKLTEMANARRRYISSTSPDLDTAAWILKHVPSCRPIWDDIRELAVQAHQLNQTNGEVIQLKLRSNQQALTTLLGAAKSAAGLYGRDGQPSIPTTGRTLGSG